MQNLPTTHPAEVINISPEALEVANCYLQNPDTEAVANLLDIPKDQVATILNRREVKAYIDHLFLESGFNNRYRMREVMDALIKQKLQEMDEAGVGTNKDIMEILTLSHKMTMDMLDREIQLKKLDQANVKTQTNIQINNEGSGSRYDQLLEKLLNGPVQQSN